jgi:hypothetical protein
MYNRVRFKPGKTATETYNIVKLSFGEETISWFMMLGIYYVQNG